MLVPPDYRDDSRGRPRACRPCRLHGLADPMLAAALQLVDLPAAACCLAGQPQP